MEIEQAQSTDAQNAYREAFQRVRDVLEDGGIGLKDSLADALLRAIPRKPVPEGEFPLCVCVPNPDEEVLVHDTLATLVAVVIRLFPVGNPKLPHVDGESLEVIGGWRFVPKGEDAERGETAYWTTVSLSHWRDKALSGGAASAISAFEVLTFLAVYGDRLPADLVLRLPLDGLFQDEITSRLEAVIVDLRPGPNGPVLSFEVYQI